MGSMNTPILIQTPHENVVGYTSFHLGNEASKKDTAVTLLTPSDFDENKQLITTDIPFLEMPLKDMTEQFQQIMKDNFPDITTESIVLMRLFKKPGNEEEGYIPIPLEEGKDIKL
jgi:hypothetical protein